MDFRYDGIIEKYQTEVGRLLKADFSPVVKRLGEGLDGLRKASIGQILLNLAFPPERVSSLRLRVVPTFVRYGHLALHTVQNKTDNNGYPYIELVPPWETLSIPADPIEGSCSEGILRVRWVTRDWLEEHNLFSSSAADQDYEWQTLMKGVKAPQNMGGGSMAMPYSGTGYGDRDKRQTQQWTRLAEIWTHDSSNMIEQYVALAGRAVVNGPHDYTDRQRPMNINIARYVDCGGFYGKGFVNQLVPLNIELEFMLNQLFRNVEDFDQFGILCLSRGMGLDINAIRAAKEGPKVLVYDEDLSEKNNQPFSIHPANAGRFTTDVVKIASALLENQAKQSEMLSGGAPGRVDSASGLSLLYETSNIPLSSPLESLAVCLSDTYKAALWAMGDTWPERKAVEMTLKDDALVGISYDALSGEVELARTAIPSPREVRVTVASKSPRSETQQRMDLAQSLEQGVITPREYRIKARELGLDIPVGNDYEWQSYRRAKLENITLYGDGVEPGQAVGSNHDFHEVDLEVHSSFMARPEFRLASKAVRAAFEEHRAFHMEALGEYPDKLPYPGTDDEQAMALEQMAAGEEPGGEVRLT